MNTESTKVKLYVVLVLAVKSWCCKIVSPLKTQCAVLVSRSYGQFWSRVSSLSSSVSRGKKAAQDAATMQIKTKESGSRQMTSDAQHGGAGGDNEEWVAECNEIR
ncbi:hypothetical protein GGR57DRAFT_352831 [Xylariaceae sp. FL1272]|nr:hypothetical protein GGR57DRAFT_352831 [Xylariaceae sp. FL1272]